MDLGYGDHWCHQTILGKLICNTCNTRTNKPAGAWEVKWHVVIDDTVSSFLKKKQTRCHAIKKISVPKSVTKTSFRT